MKIQIIRKYSRRELMRELLALGEGHMAEAKYRACEL